MKLEFEKVIGTRPIDLHILEQGLHNTPKLMPGHICDKVIEVAASQPEEIILGYGLCSNGVVGVGGGRVSMVAPRCHDCISMLLGSAERYQEVFKQNPGTIYLSAGWMEAGDDPLANMLAKYIPRLGEQKAMRAITLELANYTHFCYINNGLGDQQLLQARTREHCRIFKKQYKEIQGSLEYFEKLVDSPLEGPEIIRLAPGQKLDENMFF